MAKGDTKTNDYLDIAAHGERGDFPASCCETRSQTLIREVGERIMDLEAEVQELENNPDVVDIVDTYADLTAYDTSGLTDKDVIRVITDETKGGLSSYYRWNSPDPGWNFVGVIPGGDGIKELSSADYNYPTGSPDRVALWLLDNGLYTAPAGVMVAASTTSYPWYNTSDKTILVGGSDTVKGIYTFLNGKVDVVTTQVSDGTEADEYTLLKSTQVLQATGQSTTDTMSQKAITDAIADGGGVTELTTADYNANSNNWSDTDPANFNCIAYWKLDIGVYHHASGVRVATNYATISSTHERMVIVSTKTSTETHILYQSDNDAWQYGAIAPGGGGEYSPLVPTVVRMTGTSQTSVMSQFSTSSMVFADPSTKLKIRIGQSGAGVGTQSIAIGNSASATNSQSVALGYNSQSTGYNSVALGYGSTATSKGQFDVGTGTYTTAGYNDSNYRLLTGLYDPQSDHDAATKGYVDAHGATLLTNTQFNQILENA